MPQKRRKHAGQTARPRSCPIAASTTSPPSHQPRAARTIQDRHFGTLTQIKRATSSAATSRYPNTLDRLGRCAQHCAEQVSNGRRSDAAGIREISDPILIKIRYDHLQEWHLMYHKREYNSKHYSFHALYQFHYSQCGALVTLLIFYLFRYLRSQARAGENRRLVDRDNSDNRSRQIRRRPKSVSHRGRRRVALMSRERQWPRSLRENITKDCRDV